MIGLALFLTGCGVATRVSTPIPMTETVIPIVETAVIPDAPTRRPTRTRSAPLEPVSVCAGQGQHSTFDSAFSLNGTLIYQNDDASGLFTLSGLPLQKQDLLPGSSQKNEILGLSPNGEWLAYHPIEPGGPGGLQQFRVVLLSADGKQTEQTLDLTQFQGELQAEHQFIGASGFSHWVNDALIYASFYSSNPSATASGAINDLPKFFNPFDGSWQANLLSLPDRFSSDPVGISPDLSRAFYDGKASFVLWDMENQQSIYEKPLKGSSPLAFIVWAADSSQVAYVNPLASAADYEVRLLLVSRDGVAYEPLSGQYPVPGLMVHSVDWSPDHRRLALLGSAEGMLSVLLYDTAQQKFMMQCPLQVAQKGIRPTIAWSPDGTQLAISDIQSPIIVFDLSSGKLVELPYKGNLIGWAENFSGK